MIQLRIRRLYVHEHVDNSLQYKFDHMAVMDQLAGRLFLRTGFHLAVLMQFELRRIRKHFTGLAGGTLKTSVGGPWIGPYPSELHIDYDIEAHGYLLGLTCNDFMVHERIPESELEARGVNRWKRK